MTIGDRIKLFRKKSNLTQTELADKSGLSRNAIYNYENEKRSPDMSVIEKIADALKISAMDLIFESLDIGETFINDEGQKIIVVAKDNGNISEKDAIEGIVKYINYIANSENYVMADEYNDIIYSTEELIRGKILILKSKRGKKISLNDSILNLNESNQQK